MSTEPNRPVIVGVDGSAASLDAVDLAADEAMARVVPLLVLHVSGGQPAQSQAAHELLAMAVQRARSDHPGLSITAEIAAGKPAEVLLRRSAQACLIVVGHVGHNLIGRLALGSVAMSLIGHACVPVIVYRPIEKAPAAHPPVPRPVLVGVAPGPDSAAVIDFAFTAASLRGTSLHAMYVWAQPADAELPDIHADHRGFTEAHEEAERMLAEALAGWPEKYPEVSVERTVRHSLDAAVALTAASTTAQLAVVGGSRDARMAHLLSASVSHTLAHRAGCPVAVVGGG